MWCFQHVFFGCDRAPRVYDDFGRDVFSKVSKLFGIPIFALQHSQITYKRAILFGSCASDCTLKKSYGTYPHTRHVEFGSFNTCSFGLFPYAHPRPKVQINPGFRGWFLNDIFSEYCFVAYQDPAHIEKKR